MNPGTSSRIFTLADQLAFAELSGDNNPLHIDPVIARRCLFGRPIVHGMHSLMWALDTWLAGQQKSIRLTSLRAAFLKPVGLEQTVQLSVLPAKDHQGRLELQVEGVVAAKIIFEWADNGEPAGPIRQDFPVQQAPDLLSAAEIQSQSGVLELHLPTHALQQRFPHLARWFPPSQAATLLSATRLVGVKCPGLQSIFSELTLAAGEGCDRPELQYAVTEFEDRYGMVLMKLKAPGLNGGIKAFVRPEPQSQATFPELKKLVTSGEFAGEKALVVGGSRGLGEVTAKLLAAGGAQVQLTYHQGRADAQKIVGEIIAGGSKASACPFNVMDTKSAPPGLEAPTHLYYFATPFITTSAAKYFSTDLFNSFCNYYVGGFTRTVELLTGLGLKKVFYPSTVFIEELPDTLIEYAVAKQAGEAVCQALAKKYPELALRWPRLPKMATDQTVGLLSARNADPAAIVLSALRDFHA